MEAFRLIGQTVEKNIIRKSRKFLVPAGKRCNGSLQSSIKPCVTRFIESRAIPRFQS